MKVHSTHLPDLVNRTIFVRGQAWFVVGLTEDGEALQLRRGGTPGRITRSQLKSALLYPSHEEILVRYPRLIGAMREAAILTEGEAVGAIVGYIVNGPFDQGSEAVSHFGGSGRVIEAALRMRHIAARKHRARHKQRQAPELVVDYCSQVCRGGQCGTGALCPTGVDPNTRQSVAHAA